MVQSVVALGANIGDAAERLVQATDCIAKTSGLQLCAVSSLYRTKAVGPPQPDYINAAILLETDLSPFKLHRILQGIEHTFGRVRVQTWGPRTLDLDIIFYGDIVLQTPQLIIPHPLWQSREFVLQPMRELGVI